MARKSPEPLRQTGEGPLRSELEAEIQRLARQRWSDQLEDQLLSDFTNEDDFSLAVTAFLRRIVPQPAASFAALVLLGTDSQSNVKARGLADQSFRRFQLPKILIERLKIEDSLIIDPAHDATGLSARLDDSDRVKARRIHLTALKDHDGLFAILMTSASWPHGMADVDRRTFVNRFARFVGMRWRQSRVVEQQTLELRVLQDVLELRSIIDSHTDEPMDALRKFAERLCEATDADQGAIFLVVQRGERLRPIIQCAGCCRWRQPGCDTSKCWRT